MSVRKFETLDAIQGADGTTIRQIFHPHNTFNGINHSLAHFVLEQGKKSYTSSNENFRNILHFRRKWNTSCER